MGRKRSDENTLKIEQVNQARVDYPSKSVAELCRMFDLNQSIYSSYLNKIREKELEQKSQRWIGK